MPEAYIIPVWTPRDHAKAPIAQGMDDEQLIKSETRFRFPEPRRIATSSDEGPFSMSCSNDALMHVTRGLWLFIDFSLHSPFPMQTSASCAHEPPRSASWPLPSSSTPLPHHR